MERSQSKKFLYIVGAFPPLIGAGGIRAFEFSKRLINNQIYPIILTRTNHKKELINKKHFNEIPSSLQVHRTKYFPLKNIYIRELLNLFFRIDYYTDWIPFAYIKGKKILKKNKDIKFIMATGLPVSTFIVGYLLKKKFNIPLVVEYRDPWSYNPFFPKTLFWLNQKLDLIIEKQMLKLSDVIITVSPELSNFLINRFSFIKNKPIYAIANGLNIDDERFNHQIKDKNQIIFTFTGKLYGGREITPLLKIITELKKENFFENRKFLLKIYGGYQKSLAESVKKSSIKDLVFFGGFILRSEAFNEISNSDLAVHIGENLNYPTLAFKIWDYLSLGKKILYIGREDSYTSKFLNEHNFGITLPINDLKRGKLILKSLIEQILQNNLNNTITKEQIRDFTWNHKYKEFQAIIYKYFFN